MVCPIKVHNRIQLLKWSGIILSAYIADIVVVVIAAAAVVVVYSKQRAYTVYHILWFSGPVIKQTLSILAYSRCPCLHVFNNQRLSIFCLSRMFMSRIFHPLQLCAVVSVSCSFHPCILVYFGAVVSFAVVSCLAFSASPL